MIRAKWAPTPLGLPAVPVAIRMPGLPTAARMRDLWRTALRLAWRRELPAGVALRIEFERLGGLWVKVGQWLSMRGDLFPADFCAALSTLQGHAVGFPAWWARHVLEQQLGCRVSAVFDRFEDVPVAAASMGQVHRARLRQGQVWVAVKVRTPYAPECFLADVAFLAILVRLAPWIGLLFLRSPQWIVRLRLHEGLAEIRRIVVEELDFRFEANHQRRMRRTLRRHDLVVGKVYTAYSTDRVLVSEWVPGVTVRAYLDLLAADAEAAAVWRAENGIEPSRIARRLVLSLFRQLFEDNRYHGDLHPSNIMLLRGCRIALLDFGTSSRTEVRFLARFRSQVQAIASRNYQRAAELTNQMTAALPAKTWWITKVRHASRIEELVADLVRTMEYWANRAEVETLPYREKSLNACTSALTATVLAHGGSMQWSWMRIQRTIGTLDGSLPLLAPGLNYVKLVRRYFAQAAARVSPLAPLWALYDLWNALPDVIPTALSLPERVSLEMSQLRQELSPLQGL